ncbi:MAG: DUF1841 family protein [Deltaproteobacteria bacterium]|nr:DUF1841 family protein [Deltaproteobacteria bacterium]
MIKQSKNLYQFKVTLLGIRPPIWRRIQVPENYSFWDLHVAIQDAMGWSDYHLHAFAIQNPKTGKKEEIGIPDDHWEGKRILPGWEQKIKRYFTLENNKALYSYDFSDDWQHEIKLEKIIPHKEGIRYPVCVTGKRACPPEDCGGIFGYEDLLEILSDPDHEEYEDTREWLGNDFNPDHFSVSEIVFDDPDRRFEYAFHETEDLMEDDDFDESEESEEEMLQLKATSREFIHSLWERAKANDLDGLSPDELKLARIIKDHEDEFFNQFEFADILGDHEFDPEIETNPFLHIFIHLTVEDQLASKEPIEAFQFYNAMRQKRCSHHETIHMIGAILAPMMLSVMHRQEPFDANAYASLLKKYKNRNPNKIFDLLEKEAKLYSTDG